MKPTIIKRYPNRKLYNTATASYINLTDIPALLRENPYMSVLDHETGLDITQVTLLKALNPASFTYDELVTKLTETV